MVNLILRLVYSCLVDSFLYFIYLKVSLGTYTIINLLVPPRHHPLGGMATCGRLTLAKGAPHLTLTYTTP